MKMKHEKTKELLQLYIDDMLNETQRKEVESHLRVCKDCKRELDYLRIVEISIKTYPLLETPTNFAEDVISNLQLSGQRRNMNSITELKELPKFVLKTITTSLKEASDHTYNSVVLAIQKTKHSLAFALYSSINNLKASFSNINFSLEWR